MGTTLSVIFNLFSEVGNFRDKVFTVKDLKFVIRSKINVPYALLVLYLNKFIITYTQYVIMNFSEIVT